MEETNYLTYKFLKDRYMAIFIAKIFMVLCPCRRKKEVQMFRLIEISYLFMLFAQCGVPQGFILGPPYIIKLSKWTDMKNRHDVHVKAWSAYLTSPSTIHAISVQARPTSEIETETTSNQETHTLHIMIF